MTVKAELERARKPRAYNATMLGRCAPVLVGLVNTSQLDAAQLDESPLDGDDEPSRARVVLEMLAELCEQLPDDEREAFSVVCLSTDRRSVAARRADFATSASAVVRNEDRAIARLAPLLVGRLTTEHSTGAG